MQDVMEELLAAAIQRQPVKACASVKGRPEVHVAAFDTECGLCLESIPQFSKFTTFIDSVVGVEVDAHVGCASDLNTVQLYELALRATL